MSHDYCTGPSPDDLRKLGGLLPAQRDLFLDIRASCAARGAFLRVDRAVDGPWRQARLWRQSRSAAAIRDEVARLRSRGAPWLASVIESVGPQPSGPWATNAIPGLSWHQWGGLVTQPDAWAVDVIWMVDGAHVSWSTGEDSGYRVWRDEATKAGMHHGPTNDWAHMQCPPQGAPVLRLGEIDAAMRERWERVGDQV